MRYVPLIAWMGIIFFLSHQPATAFENTGVDFLDVLLQFLKRNHFDKCVHCGLYLVMAQLFTLAFGAKPFINVITCVCYGFSDELHQCYIPGRCFDMYDLIADATGAIIGSLVSIQLILGYLRKNRAREKTETL